MAVSIFVINSNSQEELPPLEDCRLYRVNITELLSKPDVYESFFNVLSDVSDGEINREMLKIMAANRRHELYVLLGPVVNWDGDTPIIYSGIQVCVEGNIADVPDLGGEKFSDCFFVFRDMPENLDFPELVGVNILKVYAVEQDYANTAVQLMTRYYNGDAAEDALQLIPELEGHIFIQLQTRTWPLVHYVGVFDKPNLALFDHWTSNGFSPIIIGKIKYLKYKKEVVCAMIKWLNDYEPIVAANIFWSHPQLFSLARNNFKKWLSGDLNSVDHSFAARILEMEFYSCRSPILKERPWNEVEDRIIVAINRGAPVSLEVMDPVIRKVADIYFNAVLPIMLSEVDRSLLLLRGLQFRPTDEIMRIMNLSEEDIRQSLGKTLATAFDYVYGLLPEVVD
ncbi:RNA cytidine acetyltransferase 2-like isoform X2 [Sesamum indicum]|uniref:RNA cytidine acetyltransferase 2-like isoform X2 n=1 Tax=Sesamum indicum TaxID=4182 RepID=A0A6I9T4R4_SESIN|nr:RNA cytidine acetyltransferase 2-like isoform X2 [Sesamum indicum]